MSGHRIPRRHAGDGDDAALAGRPAGDRTIIAHLGNGASITAVRQGRSIDTSMGLTPSGGIVGRLSCLGVAFDAGRNEGGQNPLNPACGQVAVMALPSREDEVIAHHTARLAARLPDPGRAQPVQPGAA